MLPCRHRARTGLRLKRPATVALVLAMALAFGAADAGAQQGASRTGRGAPALPAPPPTPAGDVVPLTLAESVYLGLRGNRAIRSAYIERVAQRFDLRVAEDRFNPRLTISSAYRMQQTNGQITARGNITPVATLELPTGAVLGFTWANTDTDTRGGARNRSSTLGLTAIQPLLRGAGVEVNTASVRIARLNEQANQSRLRDKVAQTVTLIVLAYRDLVRAQEQRKLAQAALQRSQSLLDVNRALITAGRMAEVDIVQTEADVASQELALLEAANQLDATRLKLLNLLAVDPQTRVTATDRLDVERVSVSLDRVLPLAHENRPDHLAQTATVEQLRLGLIVARNQRLWDLSAVASAGYGREMASGTGLPASARMNNDVSAGLQLTIPLGDRTLEQGEVRASTSVRAAEVQLEELRQQIESEVRDAVRDVEARWRQVEVARRARDLATRSLQIERDKLSVGRSSNFQVLSVENDLRRAENQQLNAAILYLNALTQLDARLGTTLDTWQIALNP